MTGGAAGFGLACLSALVIGWTLWVEGERGDTSIVEVPRPASVVRFLGEFPFEQRPTPIACNLPVRPLDMVSLAKDVAFGGDGEAEPLSRSRMLHAVRLEDMLEGQLQWIHRGDAGDIERVTLSPQALVPTWRGLEVVTTPDGERTEHRDQLLASLAEAGAPLSCRLEGGPGGHTVADLLETALAEFSLEQAEMSWTATALVLYLPPQASWTNRFGETYTFDDLATELMARSLASESCRGTHLVFTLTYLLAVDRTTGVLSPEVRQRVREHLDARVRTAVETQLPDGSWPMLWAGDAFGGPDGELFTPEPTLLLQITVTGHLLEWFHYLPPDMKPPETTVKAGAMWLWTTLQAASPEDVARDFCPYTHAIRALDLAFPSLQN